MVVSKQISYYATPYDKSNRKTGVRFQVELADDTGRIRAVAFNQTPDEFSNKLQINKVHTLSLYTLKKITVFYKQPTPISFIIII